MLSRAYVPLIAVVIAVTLCYAGKPIVRDGSTIERAIPLKQRTAKAAVEEEMTWMMKLYHYTPVLATRDAFVEAIRQIKVEKKKEVRPPNPWGHASREYDGRLISYWWFVTPHGRKEIYFDTGMAIDTPGEVARRESTCAQYMAEKTQSLKLQ
jgi:hypothetical protein